MIFDAASGGKGRSIGVQVTETSTYWVQAPAQEIK